MKRIVVLGEDKKGRRVHRVFRCVTPDDVAAIKRETKRLKRPELVEFETNTRVYLDSL